MDQAFLWAQIIGLIAFVISTLKYQIKNTRHVLFAENIATIFWAIHVFMLGSIQAAIVNSIAIIRGFLSLYIEKKYIKYVLITSFIIASVIVIPTIEKGVDALPLIGFGFYGMACFYQDNPLLFRIVCTLGNAIWLAYALIIFSIPLAATCLFSIISSLIGLYRHERQNVMSLISFMKPKTYP